MVLHLPTKQKFNVYLTCKKVIKISNIRDIGELGSIYYSFF